MLDVGAAIETVHNFTLVHDDIMDDDDVRRGRNAVHIEFDLPTAINAGDAMLAIAFESLVQAEGLEDKDVAPLVNRIAWMVRKGNKWISSLRMNWPFPKKITSK